MSDVQGAATPPATTTEAPATTPSGVASLLPANPSTELRVTTDKVQTASSPDTTVSPDAWYAKAAADADTIGWLKAKNFPDLKTALASHRSLEQTIGMDKVAIPAKPDDPAWEQVYAKLGRPETPAAYGLDKLEGAEPGFTAWAAKTFHARGLNPAQVHGIVQEYQAYGQEQAKLREQALKQDQLDAVGNLQGKYGVKLEQQLKLADRVAAADGLSTEELQGIRSVLGTERTLEWLIKRGNEVAEDAGVTGETVRQSTMLSPAAAQARLNALHADPAWQSRWNSSNDAVRKGADAERLPLYRIIHGET